MSSNRRRPPISSIAPTVSTMIGKAEGSMFSEKLKKFYRVASNWVSFSAITGIKGPPDEES